MFTAFQKLGAHAQRDYEQEDIVKEETFALLERSGGGKFFAHASRRIQDGLVELDAKKARGSTLCE